MDVYNDRHKTSFIDQSIIEHLQKSLAPLNHLSNCQCLWIGFCLIGILITNSIAWVLGNALYRNSIFIDEIGKIWPDIQVISQLRANQKIKAGKRTISYHHYFKSYRGWSPDVSIRG